MTFISIAIFTVYTTHMVFVGGCAYMPPRPWPIPYPVALASAGNICADLYSERPEEMGRSEPVYAGEFPTIEACQKAAGAMKYVPKKAERVGDITQVLCVPKSSAGKPAGVP
jgi:hypothetical protein